jgi:hypothetical protein
MYVMNSKTQHQAGYNMARHARCNCTIMHCRDKCLALAGCFYCKNKYSPMPGSDGVCLSADQAKLLPKTGYECESGPPQDQQQQQPHAQASVQHKVAGDKQPSGGGDDNCGKLREK